MGLFRANETKWWKSNANEHNMVKMPNWREADQLAIYEHDWPCIRLARRKFELTNQDSVGGKNSSVLM